MTRNGRPAPEQDRLTKAPIYAAAGVPEYWIVDIPGQQVEIHCDPDRAARRYRTVATAGRAERVTLTAFPDTTIAVDDLLPHPPSRIRASGS